MTSMMIYSPTAYAEAFPGGSPFETANDTTDLERLMQRAGYKLDSNPFAIDEPFARAFWEVGKVLKFWIITKPIVQEGRSDYPFMLRKAYGNSLHRIDLSQLRIKGFDELDVIHFFWQGMPTVRREPDHYVDLPVAEYVTEADVSLRSLFHRNAIATCRNGMLLPYPNRYRKADESELLDRMKVDGLLWCKPDLD